MYFGYNVDIIVIIIVVTTLYSTDWCAYVSAACVSMNMCVCFRVGLMKRITVIARLLMYASQYCMPF